MCTVAVKLGDRGHTLLYDGSKVAKDHLIIDCIGNIEEISAEISVVIAHLQNLPFAYVDLLYHIQNHLSELQGLVGCKQNVLFDIDRSYTKVLDKAIAEMKGSLPSDIVEKSKQKNNIHTALITRCRAVCRRTERKLVKLKSYNYNENDSYLMYFNRLADFLLVLAMYVIQLQQH